MMLEALENASWTHYHELTYLTGLAMKAAHDGFESLSQEESYQLLKFAGWDWDTYYEITKKQPLGGTDDG